MNLTIEIAQENEAKQIPVLPKVPVLKFLFFLIWPFGALLSAIKNFRKPYSKTILWLFCVYFGFVFIYANPYGKGGADSARYSRQLMELHNSPISFQSLKSMLYNPRSGLTDIYQPILTWFVSVFTGDPRILFAIFATIFGFFWTQNLWLIFSRINIRVEILLLLFMLGYALVNPIWNINGVRMWTAAQIYLYGVLIYLLEEKKIGLIWVASSVLVHFSFMFPAALFITYLFLPKFIWIYFTFFIVTSFIREIDLKAVRDALSYLPEIFQTRIESYTNEEYVKSFTEKGTQLSWHVKFSQIGGRAIIYLWIFYLFFNKDQWDYYSFNISKIFKLGLFIGGFAQLASLLPSGGRFINVVYSLIYAVVILCISEFKTERIPWLLKMITIPVIVFLILFNMRVGFDYIGILVFVGNPIFALFISDQTPLIYFIKQLVL
mgnify:FL=1